MELANSPWVLMTSQNVTAGRRVKEEDLERTEKKKEKVIKTGQFWCGGWGSH